MSTADLTPHDNERGIDELNNNNDRDQAPVLLSMPDSADADEVVDEGADLAGNYADDDGQDDEHDGNHGDDVEDGQHGED